jgi:hypothetical protein
MNPDIGSIIEYIATNYSDKIGNIAIITNGTILIKDDVLDILNRFSVEISISDYTSEVNYTDTLRKLISRLDEKKVHYTVNQSILWNNFGFPEDLFSFETDDDTRRHMLSCSPLFLGINEGKICYCNVAWSAMKSKLFTTEEETFDLKILHGYEGRQRLLEYCMGDVPKGYLEFCKVCGGCGSDNNHFVDAGCQINRG